MIDLRSDTVTKPTLEMRKAAFEAEVGDDVYNEDPTVLTLEKEAATILGKEAAMFVPSGTQGNQIAVLTHCQSGQEIILEAESHIFYYEGAAISAFAGVQPRTIKGERGAMDPRDIEAAIRDSSDIHVPETGLICIENTHNRAGGAVVPLANMKEVHAVASKQNIPIHLDGARLFNAAAATGINVREFAAYTDTVQFCLSKGLGAPVGSIIAGSETFIKKARKWRKRLGGGLRQVGIIAAPGLVALRTMTDRLTEDHQNAKLLSDGLQQINGLRLENVVETNIVLVNTENTGLSSQQFIELLKSNDILAVSFGPFTVRFTTHYDVSESQIKQVINKVNQLLK
ncbi:low-specificity L-threonine aldolase [Bacillus sp. Marseille-P3661]|uniref:low-specificity L-threonine aldolase n=1 Tax=Bacillus sp. Marseille-P3661 TaxID=1936234 RepID=UPI000C81A11C|nr:low-specificity L-threonine aldolase [Bacillus sp. Marseille-P3661]